MMEVTDTQSFGQSISRAWRSHTAKKALLIAGIVAVGLYPVADLVSGLLYQGYSFKDWGISELMAIGSPVRPGMLAFMIVYAVLGAAFGVGIWRSAGRSRSMRWVGLIFIAASILGLVLHPFFPMTARGVETTFTDTMHQSLTSVWSIMVSVAVVLAAVAYRGWFRAYSIATLLVQIAFGSLAMMAMGGFPYSPTPWAGAFERVSAYAFMAWMVVLAVTAMRRSLDQLMLEKGATEPARMTGRSIAVGG
jgi:uncharacterized protein DUF998